MTAIHDRKPGVIAVESIRSGIISNGRGRAAVLGFIFLLLILPPAGLADSQNSSALRLTGEKETHSLAPYLELLEDPGRNLTIADLTRPENQARFRADPEKLGHIGLSRSAWWFRFRVERSEPERAETWLLNLNRSILGEVDLYVPLDGCTGPPDCLNRYDHRQTGIFRPAFARDVHFRNFVFKLPKNFADGEYFYLRLTSPVELHLPALVQSHDAFDHYSITDSLGFGVIYGVLMGMVLYNLFIFFVLRDRAYLYYVLYVTSMLVYQSCEFGQIALMMNADNGEQLILLWIFVGSAMFWGGAFVRFFLAVKNNSRLLDRLLQTAMVLSLFVPILGIFGEHRLANMVAHITGIFGSASAITAGILIYRRGFEPARYFLMAWSFLLVAVVVWSSAGLGFLPAGAFTTYALPVGAALEAILLSFALADRIRILNKEREAAEAASLAKSTFLAGMSHEIRTPMNAIIGLTDVVLETNLDEMQQDYLRTVNEAGRHLMSIIENVLDFSKIEAGKLTLIESDFEPRRVVEVALGTLNHQACQKGLEVNLQIADGVPRFVRGDPARLRQILINLVGNAVKFTARGEIDVTVERLASPDDSIPLRFAISDTGIGIPSDKRKKIFNSFDQAADYIQVQYGGTGLGLAICRRLVEMMNGQIWLDSREGQGSTFYFTARFGAAAKTEETAPQPATPEPSRVRPIDILLVEDNPANVKVAELQLAKLGHRTATANNGRQALDQLVRKKFDLVLMDLEMPEMDGITCTRLIREGHDNLDPQIPIIAMTAHAVKEIEGKCLAAGMNAFLTKPVRYHDLAEIIGRFVPDSPEKTSKEPLEGPNETTGCGVVELARPVEVPVWLKEEARKMMGLDDEEFRRIVSISVEELDTRARNIAEALKKGQLDAAAREAHTIKSSAAGIGAKAAQAAITALEKTARAGEAANAAELHRTLLGELEKLKKAVEAEG